MKIKVVFITYSRGTHVTMALKARDPVRAGDINGKVMNSKTKTEKCSYLANGER
jgi:hypothetical protein